MQQLAFDILMTIEYIIIKLKTKTKQQPILYNYFIMFKVIKEQK